MALPRYTDQNEEQRRAEFDAWLREHQLEHDICVKFLSCVHNYDVEGLNARYSEIGELVNFADWHNQATALHYAAATSAREIVLWLCQQPEIDHLIRDRFGRLPSMLAYEVAGNVAIGRYLAHKEHKQARAQEIDLLQLVPPD